jgi:hypothetical protein
MFSEKVQLKACLGVMFSLQKFIIMTVVAIGLMLIGNWNVWIRKGIQIGFDNLLTENTDVGIKYLPFSGKLNAGTNLGLFVIIMDSLSAVVSAQKDIVLIGASLSLYCVIIKATSLTAERPFVLEQV